MTKPDYCGKVFVLVKDGDVTYELPAWYETGERRFEEGFSMMNPKLIPKIIDWRDAREENKKE